VYDCMCMYFYVSVGVYLCVFLVIGGNCVSCLFHLYIYFFFLFFSFFLSFFLSFYKQWTPTYKLSFLLLWGIHFTVPMLYFCTPAVLQIVLVVVFVNKL